MATVHYGLAGEGRGHAARAATIIDHLAKRHRVVVHSFGQALELLAPRYAGTEVLLRQIPGLHLSYQGTRVSKLNTLRDSMPYLRRFTQATDALVNEMGKHHPALVVSDFEPLIARAAQRLGVPWVSIDHQRLLWVCQLGGLGVRLRAQAWAASAVLRRLYGVPTHQAVSGFYLPPLRPGVQALRAGVLLREEILSARSVTGDHFVAYVRRGCPNSVIAALSAWLTPVRVYGLGRRTPQGLLTFHETSTDGFVNALASCRGLITTAGNQLIGEAHYLGKPVLAFPEPGNFEQEINAALLVRSGGGMAVDAEALSPARLAEFERQLPEYRTRIVPNSVCGNETILAWIDALLLPNDRAARSAPKSRVLASTVSPRS